MKDRALYISATFAARAVAAFGGGYVLTSLLVTAGALLLTMSGIPRAEAVLAMTMASFPVYALIILAVFRAQSARRAWAMLALASVPAALFSVLYDESVYGAAVAGLSLNAP